MPEYLTVLANYLISIFHQFVSFGQLVQTKPLPLLTTVIVFVIIFVVLRQFIKLFILIPVIFITGFLTIWIMNNVLTPERIESIEPEFILDNFSSIR